MGFSRSFNLFAWIAILVVAELSAQEIHLLRTVSPTIARPRMFSAALTGGYETGAIPTAVVSPRLSYGIIRNLQAQAGVSFAYFRDQEERRLSGIDGELRYRLIGSAAERLDLYAYGGAKYAPGDAVTTPYENDLPEVHTVIAEHGDPGLDLFGGVLATNGPLLQTHPLYIGLSAEYARTGMREYYPSFEEEGYMNRIRLNAVPYLLLQPGRSELTVALQNRYTYWFDRGNMLDLIGQVSVAPNDRFDIVAGVSLPAMGGEVFKFLLQTNISFEVAVEREIRIRVRDLHFPPDRAILYGPENEKSDRNRRRIKRLYRRLEQYPEYSIVVEGHTSWVYWDDPVKGPQEQEEVLIPLSRARARAVMEALAELGLSRSRMSYVGKGGSEPEVPFDDPAQWKNRRVEIVLVKE